MAATGHKRKPLADRMFDTLLEELLSGRRGAGEPLNIGQLGREFDVSQTPLREALARLEHTGLVVRLALKGYRVAPALTDGEVAKLMRAREVLEPEITYEAGLRTTPEFLAELEKAVDAVAATTGAADTDPEIFREYQMADTHFHVLISEQCDNEFLVAALHALEGHLARFRLFSKMGRTGAGHAATEHRAIYEAYVAGDAGRARDLMREHIVSAARRQAMERPARG